MSFMNWVAMWKPQVDWCLAVEAETAVSVERAAQIVGELRYSTLLANQGCGMNKMGDTCADGAFDAISGTCPMTQVEVDDWVDSYGCCVASYAHIAMARMELGAAGTPCAGDFEFGKSCKAPKWKMPKKQAKAASMGKAKKGALAGGLVGGVVGLSLLGLALRKRKAKLAASKPQTAAGQVAMTHAVAI